ncbi:unnamed protein product [Protopolystoma xenopodis]|uniref:Uncharacterized protein n=1 Tax=Protopolystoma xenopodis TaxID=117903 RepID=A0A3S4ZVK7_9PLAT|nr:unnamed protein product [Protopolystoma xenopodis]
MPSGPSGQPSAVWWQSFRSSMTRVRAQWQRSGSWRGPRGVTSIRERSPLVAVGQDGGLHSFFEAFQDGCVQQLDKRPPLPSQQQFQENKYHDSSSCGDDIVVNDDKFEALRSVEAVTKTAVVDQLCLVPDDNSLIVQGRPQTSTLTPSVQSSVQSTPNLVKLAPRG